MCGTIGPLCARLSTPWACLLPTFTLYVTPMCPLARRAVPPLTVHGLCCPGYGMGRVTRGLLSSCGPVYVALFRPPTHCRDPLCGGSHGNGRYVQAPLSPREQVVGPLRLDRVGPSWVRIRCWSGLSRDNGHTLPGPSVHAPSRTKRLCVCLKAYHYVGANLRGEGGSTGERVAPSSGRYPIQSTTRGIPPHAPQATWLGICIAGCARTTVCHDRNHAWRRTSCTAGWGRGSYMEGQPILRVRSTVG